jgi:HAD superfamily hydrolase (TIGR01484 family)
VEAGFDVILCTGRSAVGTAKVHRTLGLPTPYVAFNGAWIGRIGQTPWRYAPIPDELIEHVEGTERRAHFSFRHHRDSKYTLRSAHAEHERVVKWYENVVSCPDAGAMPRTDLMRVSLYFDAEPATHEAWNAIPEPIRGVLYRETFPLSIFPEFPESGLVLCEVQARGRGKAEAFEWLAHERGIPAERTIAVGDQRNDLSMLREAGLAVAMGNAVDDVLAEADLVIGHHAEEGFAAWVEAGAPAP